MTSEEDVVQVLEDLRDYFKSHKMEGEQSTMNEALYLIEEYGFWADELKRAEELLDEVGVHAKDVQVVNVPNNDEGPTYLKFYPGDMVLVEYLQRLRNCREVGEVWLSSDDNSVRFELK